MRFYFDTEFIDDGKTIELLSIGIVARNGETFYAENADADLQGAVPWVRENVISKMQGPNLSRDCLASTLKWWVDLQCKGEKPEFWAYYGAYDWVALCQLYGPLMDRPTGWPMRFKELAEFADSIQRSLALPPKPENVHHALADAQWVREAYNYLCNVTASEWR